MELLDSSIPMRLSLFSSAALELTARCNYRCPFCYCIWHEQGEQPAEINSAEWKKIIDALAGAEVWQITFTGGEPLLKEGLEEILEYAAGCNCFKTISIYTNASRLSVPFLKQLKNWNINLNVSLQGLRTYGQSTGTRRTFPRTLNVMETAKELGLKVHAGLTATSINRLEYIDMVAASALIGVDSITCVPFMVAGRGLNHPELALSVQEWNELKKQVSGRAFPCLVAFGNEMQCRCESEDIPSCGAGRRHIAIDPAGYVRSCLHTKTILGHWSKRLAAPYISELLSQYNNNGEVRS